MKYQVDFSLFVYPGEESIRHAVVETNSPESAKEEAIARLKQGEKGKVYYGSEAYASKFVEVPRQYNEFADVIGKDLSETPLFAVNFVREVE